MKNPNGQGSVYKLSGNRRKPWIAVVTVGHKYVNGRKTADRKTLGYFKTKQEADKARELYNTGLIDPLKVGMTFKELYKAWSDRHFKTIGHHTIESYTTGFNCWEEVHDERFDALKHTQLQDIIDQSDKSHSSKSKMRSVVRQMAEYAMLNDIIVKDYTDGLKVGKHKPVRPKVPFTEAEVKRLWSNLYTVDNVDLVLIQIYTGLRPTEFVEIRTENVNLEERWIKGGLKTEAGKDRLIPIHKLIHPLILARLDASSDWMIGVDWNYHNYRVRFDKVMQTLNMNHTPHECRTTFATRIARTDADKLTVKRILGHSDKDITDKVYTKKDIEDLLQAIDQQPF